MALKYWTFALKMKSRLNALQRVEILQMSAVIPWTEYETNEVALKKKKNDNKNDIHKIRKKQLRIL